MIQLKYIKFKQMKGLQTTYTKKREFQYKQPEIVVQHVYASETTKPETVTNHMRSKSYESEYLNKAQNTFGLENAKKTKR